MEVSAVTDLHHGDFTEMFDCAFSFALLMIHPYLSAHSAGTERLRRYGFKRKHTVSVLSTTLSSLSAGSFRVCVLAFVCVDQGWRSCEM